MADKIDKVSDIVPSHSSTRVNKHVIETSEPLVGDNVTVNCRKNRP